jgi:hypothetical protein
VPDAPASSPQENCPVVVLYRSFSVVRSQATNPAPLKVDEKYPLVEEEFMKRVEVA